GGDARDAHGPGLEDDAAEQQLAGLRQPVRGLERLDCGSGRGRERGSGHAAEAERTQARVELCDIAAGRHAGREDAPRRNGAGQQVDRRAAASAARSVASVCRSAASVRSAVVSESAAVVAAWRAWVSAEDAAPAGWTTVAGFA